MTNLTTSPPKSSASPDRIDRLFTVFLEMYGKHWLDLWADTDVDSVKRAWASALHGLDNECIRLALESIRTTGKPFPPTQPEFVSLCRQFVRRGPHRLALTAPRYEPPGDVFKNLRKQFDAKGRE
jgi:hypothetical protein